MKVLWLPVVWWRVETGWHENSNHNNTWESLSLENTTNKWLISYKMVCCRMARTQANRYRWNNSLRMGTNNAKFISTIFYHRVTSTSTPVPEKWRETSLPVKQWSASRCRRRYCFEMTINSSQRFCTNWSFGQRPPCPVAGWTISGRLVLAALETRIQADFQIPNSLLSTKSEQMSFHHFRRIETHRCDRNCMPKNKRQQTFG